MCVWCACAMVSVRVMLEKLRAILMEHTKQSCGLPVVLTTNLLSLVDVSSIIFCNPHELRVCVHVSVNTVRRAQHVVCVDFSSLYFVRASVRALRACDTHLFVCDTHVTHVLSMDLGLNRQPCSMSAQRSVCNPFQVRAPYKYPCLTRNRLE